MFDTLLNPWLTRGILVISAKKALWVLRCPSGLRYVILDAFANP